MVKSNCVKSVNLPKFAISVIWQNCLASQQFGVSNLSRPSRKLLSGKKSYQIWRKAYYIRCNEHYV